MASDGLPEAEGEARSLNVAGPFDLKIIDARLDFFKSMNYKRCHEELMSRISRAYLKKVYEGECFVFKFERRYSKFWKVFFKWAFFDPDIMPVYRRWVDHKPIVLLYFLGTSL